LVCLGKLQGGFCCMQVEVVHEFAPSGVDLQSQLSLQIGDVLYVLETDIESGWWAGHKKGSAVTGWFPKSAVVSPSPSTASSQPVPVHKALATCDGRPVASPQFGQSCKASKHAKTSGSIQLPAFMKLHTGPAQSLPMSTASRQEPNPDGLLENLATALEVERRFSNGLEKELQCLRELSGNEARQKALQQAWQAPANSVQSTASVMAAANATVTAAASAQSSSSTTSAVDPTTIPKPTVRDLVAAFEHRAVGPAAACAARPSSPVPPKLVERGSLVRTPSYHRLLATSPRLALV